MVNGPHAKDSLRSLELARIAIWFGLLTGLVEVALLGVKKFVLGHLIKLGPDAVWMAPVADATMFLAPAVVIVLLWAWRPGPRLFQVALALFACLGAFSVVLLFSQVALYAKALIAVGVGVQAARVISPRTDGFRTLVRRTLPMAVLLVAALAAGVHGWRWFGYRQAVAELPARAERAPNVLLIVLDTVRAQSLSLYGYARPTTPNLDRWAKSAVVFERAIAPSPWTFPSHASMFTGRWPHELSADWHTPLDSRYPTLAEVLQRQGYLTAGFAANLFYCTSDFGIDRGFMHYEDYPVSVSQAVMSTSIGRELIAFSLNQDFAFRFRGWIGYEEIPGRKKAAEINDGFLQWLARQAGDRPFFAFLNYLDAHQPFLPPRLFDAKFRGDAPRGDPRHWWDRKWSTQEIQTETDAYDEAIAYIDHEMGVLFDELQRRGQLENTVVIVTSDHGEHLGEHGFMRHGNTLYMEVLHVPLIIHVPRQITAGVTVPWPVSLRDIPATVLALLNVDCADCLAGRPLLNDAGVPTPASTSFSEVSQGIRIPDRYPNAKGDVKSLIADGLHYVVNSQGAEELYDLAADPREERNLTASPDRAAALDRLRVQLKEIVEDEQPRVPTVAGGIRR